MKAKIGIAMLLLIGVFLMLGGCGGQQGAATSSDKPTPAKGTGEQKSAGE